MANRYLPQVFKVITLHRQKVATLGWVEAGVDVTEQLGNFRHLHVLAEHGDVLIMPIDPASLPVATTPVAEEEPQPVAETPVSTEEADPSAATGSAESDEGTPSPDTDGGADGDGAEAEGTAAENEGDKEVTEEDTGDEDTAKADSDTPVAEYMDDPTPHTVAEVVAYAKSHPEHVEMLLEMESEGKKRKGVMDALAELGA